MRIEEVPTKKEPKRGCGYRKPGGLYLVSDGVPNHCGRLPLPLSVCPTCSAGVKPARGWTWIEPAPLFAEKPCGSKNVRNPATMADACESCPLGQVDPNAGRCSNPELNLGKRAGLLWIGAEHYPSVADFMTEASEFGAKGLATISRRIPGNSIPRGFKIGEHVMLAHRRAISEICPDCHGTANVESEDAETENGEGRRTCERCSGEGELFTAAIFTVFKPTRIEFVCRGTESEEELDALVDRGLTPVRVERAE